MRRAVVAAALALLLAGPTRAAGTVAGSETAPVASPAGGKGPALSVQVSPGCSDFGPEEGERLFNLPPALPLSRRAKCRFLWSQAAPWSYSKSLCDFFCAEHERAGIGPEWYWSMVYGYANFGLVIGKRAPGRCYGPMDVKWPGMARQVGCHQPNDLRDPRLNVRAHVAEMAYYHNGTGETGMDLLACVFYPASPRRYHRWAPTDRKFRRLLSRLSKRACIIGGDVK